jgi:hypothetical protein
MGVLGVGALPQGEWPRFGERDQDAGVQQRSECYDAEDAGHSGAEQTHDHWAASKPTIDKRGGGQECERGDKE